MAFGGQGPAVAASVTSEQLPKKKGKPAEETSEPDESCGCVIL
jgi:hypothetical protein